jgi:phage-related baseplate assembly protein
MGLNDLKDIDFVDVDADSVETWVFNKYTEITGRTLAQGDPTRLFLLFIAEDFVRLLNNVNDTGKINLLKYSEGDFLDNLGALLCVTRIPASPATTVIEATLSAERESETVIPAGTRVSPTGSDELYFATDTDLTIPAGDTTGTVTATCTVTGAEGNGYMPGEINNIVDPVSYVDTMVNTTESGSGAATEEDDALRERIYEAPERFSVAGPTGAYAFYAKSVNSSIVDVDVSSPEPGKVNIVPLLTGGEIPGQEILDDVYAAVNADDIRPLTDQVSVVAPVAVTYDITATYYIMSDADASTVQADVATAVSEYVGWQKEKLGRDINPSKLIQMLMAVSGVKRVNVTYPAYTTVSNTQVAVADNISVTMAGSEDE